MNDQHMQGAGYAAQADFLHKVWTDDAFAARLEGDPKAVFAEMGSQIPDDLEIRVVRDTDNVKHLHIPAAPSEGEISDGDLAGAQGGTSFGCAFTLAVAFAIPKIVFCIFGLKK